MYLFPLVTLLVACTFSPSVRSATDPHDCKLLHCQHRARIENRGRPRIQSKLQHQFLNKILQTDDYLEGFALFSYSGWSDRGQVMIFRKKFHADVSYYRPNTRDNPQQKTLIQADFNNFTNNLNSDGLHDFLPKIYDGIEYEYLHARKTNDEQVEVVARVYMRMPSLSRSKPNRYLQIVDVFTALIKKLFPDQ